MNINIYFDSGEPILLEFAYERHVYLWLFLFRLAIA